MKKRKGMAGEEWPPLVPRSPGHEGQELPDILPNIPSTDKGKKSRGSKDKVVTLEAGSLNRAYRLLDKHGLQPVPDGSESFCKDSPKMKVFQDKEDLDWDLMKVAVPRPRDNVMDGINMEKKALDNPPVSSRSQPDRQKTVTMVKKKGRKKMTLAKKKQMENRSLFCGPLAKKKKKPKKKKAKKAKVEEKNGQGARISSWRERRREKMPASKFSPTLDLSAEVIRKSQLYHYLFMLQPIDLSHIFVADKHEQPQRRQRKSLKDNIVVQVGSTHLFRHIFSIILAPQGALKLMLRYYRSSWPVF